MKSLFLIACSVATIGFIFQGAAKAQSRPNVVIIISDDAGFADFGFSAGISGGGLSPRTSQVPTPNLDRLAARGVVFSRGYVAATCQPSRTAIVTGGYQNRLGIENVGNSDTVESTVAVNGYTGIPVGTKTIFSRLKDLGYSTGAVGKWHLGSNETTATQAGNRPHYVGVDEFFGFYTGGRDYTLGTTSRYDLTQVNNPLDENQSRFVREIIRQADGTVTDSVIDARPEFEDMYVTTVFGNYAVDYIQSHHDDANPFLLYQAFSAPHSPFVNSPDANDPRLVNLPRRRRAVASNIFTLDMEVGRILDALDDPNGDGNASDSIRDNTLIVFVNDNGGVGASNANDPPTNNGQLRGQKGGPLEGGIRVPFIIAGAGVSPAAVGTVFNDPVHGVDILPTVIEAAGGNVDADAERIDGINLLPFINNGTAIPERSLIYRRDGAFAVLRGDYKLVQTNRRNARLENFELYNVIADVGETNDLIDRAENAEIVEQLIRDLTDWEVVFDKQRYAFFGQTLISDNINLNDHFAFGAASGTTNWSDLGNWIDPANGNTDTLYLRDAFPGAVLEFGTSNNSYISNNDMTRPTGLEFMLNKIVLSGSFNRSTTRSAAIRGNGLLLTDDLDGVGPELEISANNTSTGNFSYNSDLNLTLYDDLTITGEGNVDVNINGAISQYAGRARNLTKTSAGRVVLTGNNDLSGRTSIQRGVLALEGAGSLNASTTIDIAEDAEFDVSARNADSNNNNFVLNSAQSLNGSGLVRGNLAVESGAEINVGPDADFGKLAVAGNLTLAAGSDFFFDLGTNDIAGADCDQVLVTGDLRLAGNLRLSIRDPDALVASLNSTDQLVLFTYTGQLFASSNAQGEITGVTIDGSLLDDRFDASSARLVDDGAGNVFLTGLAGTILGDVNLDGTVNFLDIGPFISILSSNGYQREADINQDGSLNFLDISGFITILSS